jgi:thioredoxin 1
VPNGEGTSMARAPPRRTRFDAFDPRCQWPLGSYICSTKTFDQATFDVLQAANRPVLIDVHADWCPICKQQEPNVSALMASPEFKGCTVARVNFDTQTDLRKKLRAANQSTRIVFRGKQEVARSTGTATRNRSRRRCARACPEPHLYRDP